MPGGRRILSLLALLVIGLAVPFALMSRDAPAAPAVAETLDLPYTRVVTSSVPGFEVKQAGGGIAGRFEITNPNNSGIALDGVSGGTGHGLLAWNYGLGRGAVIITSNSANTLPTLNVSNSGQGSALHVTQNGVGPTLAEFEVSSVPQVRLTRDGEGLFNGGTRSWGTSVAEALPVVGTADEYRPGDVVVMTDASTVKKSGSTYSTRVVGVVVGRPGTVLADATIAEDLSAFQTVGVAGIAEPRVTASNGRIRVGDLIVTSGREGVGMRGRDRSRMLGAIIGKALAPFSGPGLARIPVLMMLG